MTERRLDATLLGMLVAALLLALAPSETAWLRVRDCPALDQERVEALTMLELNEAPTDVQVEVSCASPQRFHIQLRFEDGHTSKRDVARVGEAAERYLAVELVELLVSLDLRASEPAATPEPIPEPVEPPTPAPAPEPLPRLWLDGTLRFEGGGEPWTPLGGVGLGLTRRLWRGLSLRVDGTGLLGGRSVGSDDVMVVTASGGGSLGWVFVSARAAIQVGLGARVQGVWLRGRTQAAELRGVNHGGLTWSPRLSLGVLAPRDRKLFAVARLEAGWTPRAVRGLRDGAVVYAWSGPWIGLNVGLGGMLRP